MTDDGGTPAAGLAPSADRADVSENPPRKPSATALLVGIGLLVVGLVLFQVGQQMNLDAMVVLDDEVPPRGDVPYVLGLITAVVGFLVVLAEVARLAKQLDVVYNRAIGAPPGGE
ncbi:DUF1538 family protein [Isoptericola sp. NPDC019482]|uniref:DUF1538 family protein n=1 Tax=Isoptericola sp. NPDC019482 TaxID=3154688 RepID=UPI00347D923C